MHYRQLISRVMLPVIYVLLCLLILPRVRRWLTRNPNPRIAFLHPYCNAGGGGERVLWIWVKRLQESNLKHRNDVPVVVYSGDNLPGGELQLCANVKERFDLSINPQNLKIVPLKTRFFVEASTWPRLTLIGQSLGSMIMAAEGIMRYTPDVLIDSMGYSFSVACFKWALGCKTCSYVHYPTISTDMIGLVDSNVTTYNNAKFIAKYPILRRLKLMYYKMFAILYGFMGRRSDLVFTNSTWTNGHVNNLWNIPERTFIVYPPCDLKSFLSLKMSEKRPCYIVSVAQFRPEKDHVLQVKSMKRLIEKLKHKHPDFPINNVLLDIIGSVRNENDEKLLEGLRTLAKSLGVERFITFSKNVKFPVLLEKLEQATIGIHSMWNEHFGIG